MCIFRFANSPKHFTILLVFYSRAAKRFIQMSIMLKIREVIYNDTVASIFRRNVTLNPNKTAFMMDNQKISFKDVRHFQFNFSSYSQNEHNSKVEDLSNKVGNYFSSKGFKRGDTIALLMETKLEYSSMWLGLSKIGVVTALINSNLRKETLIHSINAASSKAIIVSAEMLEAVAELMTDDAISNMSIYVYDTEKDDVKMINNKTLNLHRALKSVSDEIVDISANSANDKLFYIYTSGTTGMPKAAVITNLRFQFMVSGCAIMFGLDRNEIVYNTLPLYHTGAYSMKIISR